MSYFVLFSSRESSQHLHKCQAAQNLSLPLPQYPGEQQVTRSMSPQPWLSLRIAKKMVLSKRSTKESGIRTVHSPSGLAKLKLRLSTRQKEQVMKRECEERGTSSLLGESVNWCSHDVVSMAVPKNWAAIQFSNSTFGYRCGGNENTNRKHIYTPMFIMALYTRAKVWEQP